MRRRLLFFVTNWLTKRLLKAVTQEDVLELTQEGWMIGKAKLNSKEVGVIQEEARALLESSLWRYMKKELCWRANLRRGEHCRTPDDLLFGSAMYHNLDTQQKFLDQLAK